jgi:hypothetical protein
MIKKGAGLISPVKNLNIQSNLIEFGIDYKKFLEQNCIDREDLCFSNFTSLG